MAFDAGQPEEDEAGGVVYEILLDGAARDRSGSGGDKEYDNRPLQPGSRVTVVLGQATGQVRRGRQPASGIDVLCSDGTCLLAMEMLSLNGVASFMTCILKVNVDQRQFILLCLHTLVAFIILLNLLVCGVVATVRAMARRVGTGRDALQPSSLPALIPICRSFR